MQNLTGKQRKYLRSLAHSYKPHVIVGRNLLNDGTLHSIELTLTANELVKVKFPSKDEMNSLKDKIVSELQCHIAGDIGKTLIIYRPNQEIEKNRIIIPE